MKQNKDVIPTMAMIMMIMCNGICMGSLIGDMRWLWTHGFNTNAAIDTVIQATLVAYTYSRIRYWHNRKNDNINTK